MLNSNRQIEFTILAFDRKYFRSYCNLESLILATLARLTAVPKLRVTEIRMMTREVDIGNIISRLCISKVS